MPQQRLAGERVQDLRQVADHAGALTRGKDDNIEIHDSLQRGTPARPMRAVADHKSVADRDEFTL
jgi:hypothetical protein